MGRSVLKLMKTQLDNYNLHLAIFYRFFFAFYFLIFKTVLESCILQTDITKGQIQINLYQFDEICYICPGIKPLAFQLSIEL